MSNSKSEDTLLYETEDSKLQGLIDWILFEPAYTPVDMKEKILAWHKADIAKACKQARKNLFEQIRVEIIGNDHNEMPSWSSGELAGNSKHTKRTQIENLLRAEQREALNRLEGKDE